MPGVRDVSQSRHIVSAVESRAGSRRPTVTLSAHLTWVKISSAVAFHEPTHVRSYDDVRRSISYDRYQRRSDGGWEASLGGSGEGGSQAKYLAFTQIVLKYIMNGAPDEVNLRY